MQDPLHRLVELGEHEKAARGLEHTPREILQQPETWKSTFRICAGREKEIKDVLGRVGIGPVSANNGSGRDAATVYLLGAGTSDYTGRALAPLLRRRWACDVWGVPSTTMLTEFEDFHRPGKPYLWISFSRSGESPEGVALLERALKEYPQIRHVVITCNAKGPMARLCASHPERALALVLDDAVNDRGVAMTSSFTNMLLAGQCLSHAGALAAFGGAVDQLADCGAKFLQLAAEVAAEVTTLGCMRAVFVGSGALRGVADECALKVVELTSGKVTTLAETPLGLRHGPMSSVDVQTVLVAFLSSEARRRGYELDLLREIDRKRLARVRLAVTAGSGEDAAELVDYVLPVGSEMDFADEYRPILDVMVGQLLGLFASLRSGLKPDQPSPNGAISRVVQPIRLYT